MSQVIMAPSLEKLGDSIGAVAIGHLDKAFRAMVEHNPLAVSEPKFLRVITGKNHPFANFGMLAADIDEATTKTALAPFRDCGGSAAVFYAGRRSAQIDAVATESGFGVIEPFPAMAVDIDRLAPTSIPEGYTFFRLGPGAELATSWTIAFSDGFEFPADIGESFKPRIESEDPVASLQYFAIARNDDQQIVATSAVSLHSGIAGLYCVATIPEERGKGLGAHVTAEPLRMFRGLGYRVGVLQASKAGKPIYDRLGFRTYDDAVLYMKVVE